MSLLIYKLTATAVVLDDLGITVTGAIGTTLDISDLRPNDVTLSATGGDLEAAINGTAPFTVAELVVVDPRSGYTGNLDATDSLTALQAHNDAHIGIQLANLGDMDNVIGNPTGNEVLQYNGGTGNYDLVEPSVVAADTVLGDLGDVDDLAAHTADAPVIFMGDGTNFDTVPIIGGTNITGVAVSGTSWTLNVDDVFLLNTGDNLESGILTIDSGASIDVASGASIDVASGATIAIATGGELTIVDAPVNPTDATNKEYVDSVAAGLDPKESVRYCTVLDVSGTYAPAGGTGGTGAFTAVDFTSAAIFDGLTAGAVAIGDRILVKSQTEVSGFADAAISGAPGGSTVSALAASTYDFDVTIDGGTLQQLSITTVASSDYDAIASLMSVQVAGGSVAFVSGAFRVTSATTGLSSTVVVAAGTGVNGDLFAAIDTADSVTTTFPTPTAGTASTQNGIYVVTTAGATGAMERASDQDGSPTSEVSGGNYTFVENGTTCANTGWVLQGDGTLTLNTDPMSWVQFSESSDFSAGDGLVLNGSIFSLDINNLTPATIALGDEIAFNDISSPNTTQNTTVENMLKELNVPYGITGTGIMVQTADDTYTKVTIVAATANPLDGLSVTSGDGNSGNPTIGLDIQGLPIQTAIDTVNDRVAVWDSTANKNVYYTVGDISGALASVNSFETWSGAGNTSGDAAVVADSATDTVTITGGGGINIDFTASTDTITYSLDISTLTAISGTIALTDQFAIDDGTNNLRVTFTDLVTDLEIPNAVGTGVGYVVSDGSGTYTTNIIAVDGAGNKEGLTIVSGNGSATTTIGLDILTNTASGGDVVTGDLFIGYDLGTTSNRTFTAQQMADGLLALSGGLINAYSSFVGGDGGTTAVAIGGDTITINGTGINVTTTNSTAGLDTITLALDIADLDAGAETLLVGDSIAVYDGTATLEYTFTDVVEDLQIPNAVGATVGFITLDGTNSYDTHTLTASTVSGLEGASVSAGGASGAADVTIGVDIAGTTLLGADIVADDELLVYSPTTATGDNRAITGQEVADGVLTISGLTGLTFSTINGQSVLTYVDATRGETLSTDSFAVTYGENRVANNDWMEIGGAVDALSGFIMPMNATIVGASIHSASVPNGNTKTFDLYVDGTIPTGGTGLLSLTGTVGNVEKSTSVNTTDINVNQNQKIRVRGDAAGGTIEDTVITLWVRWRA